MPTLSRIDIHSGNWREFAAPAIDPSQWTAVVPAAGRGSRLGSDKPKILYPVAGRTVLDWLLDFLAPNCGNLVVVLSPEGRKTVEPVLERAIPGRFSIAIQAVPRGMGDAVRIGISAVETPYVAVVWGDQVALRRSSVQACFRLQQGALTPAITCPTVFRSNPYIHFERDASGEICGLRQAREGDEMPETGESDTGFFCFRTAALRELLAGVADTQGGRSTGEFNLLPVIPLAVRLGQSVLTPHLMTLEETIGINSVADVAAVETFLRERHGHS